MQPMGERDWQVLNVIAEQIPRHLFFAECAISPRILPVTATYVPARQQFLAYDFLNALTVPTGFDRVLGVVSVDIFVPPYNFVFGIAEPRNGRAVISLARLQPDPNDNTNSKALFTLRAIKEAVHELGHTLNLKHCYDPTCVMFFSNSLADTDAKGPEFCLRCLMEAEQIWLQICKEG